MSKNFGVSLAKIGYDWFKFATKKRAKIGKKLAKIGEKGGFRLGSQRARLAVPCGQKLAIFAKFGNFCYSLALISY